MDTPNESERASAMIERMRGLESVEKRMKRLSHRPRPVQVAGIVLSGAATVVSGAVLTANLVTMQTPESPPRMGIVAGLLVIAAGSIVTVVGALTADANARERRLLRALRSVLAEKDA